MNYQLVIIGHGDYPTGVKSALTLLTGDGDRFTTFNLNAQMTHIAFEQQLTAYLASHDRVIIFADMTGGAPYQTVAKLLLTNLKPHQFMISSAPLNLILDLYMQDMTGRLTDATVTAALAKSVKQAQTLIRVTPADETATTSATTVVSDEGGI